MKKSELRKLVREVIEEAIILKRHGDEIIATSDAEDPSERGRETFKAKDKLKQAGFRWDNSIGAWKVKSYDLERAVKTAKSINPKHPAIKKLEELPDFLAGDKRLPMGDQLAKKIDTYIDSLTSEVDNVMQSEEFMKFLEFNSKFHRYSIHNSMLIWIQKRDATRVAGYKTWIKKFHRQPRKDASRIWIYAPLKREWEEEDLNGDVVTKSYLRFKPVQVIDISDTDPIDERGEVPTHDWRGSSEPHEVADKLSGYVDVLARSLNIDVTYEPARGGEGGYSAGGKINISKGNAGMAKARVFIHEIAHELMHQREKSKFKIDEPRAQIRELQADSVAYIVMRHYDIKMPQIANYLAGWISKGAKDNSAKDKIMENLTILKKVSNYIIDEIDKIANKDKTNNG